VKVDHNASATATEFARSLAAHLSRFRVGPKKVEEAKKFVRARRDLRDEPVTRKGYEYVVERIFRPTISEYAQHKLGIKKSDASCHIYSSHFHTTSDEEDHWKKLWNEFRRAYPDVDTNEESHSRRADLFISLGRDRLVSIEFKYLPANRKPAVLSCVRQVRQHLSKHQACLLVLYAGMPVSRKLEKAASEIRNELRGGCGSVVVKIGPAVEFS
jgi:hypothetical protein